MAKAKKTFEQFFNEVDAALEAKVGMGINEMGDYFSLEDAFLDGKSVEDTAKRVIKENGGEAFGF